VAKNFRIYFPYFQQNQLSDNSVLNYRKFQTRSEAERINFSEPIKNHPERQGMPVERPNFD
jgi:hypothetical protein